MAELRFSITKREDEWKIIETLADATDSGKHLSPNGKGYSRFVATQISKTFKPNCACQEDEKAIPIKKHFRIKVDDDIAKQIHCEASKLGVDPGTLISRKVLDPHLSSNKTTS